MAKALPIPAMAPQIFSKAGPRPLPPPAGSKAQIWGGAVQQAGQAVQDYGAYQDKQAQVQGKAQMDTNYRNAMLQQMTDKRVLAQQIQAAKERWQNMEYEFKVLEEQRDKEVRGEQKEAHGFRKEIATEQQRVDKEIKDFELEFTKRVNDAAAEGPAFTKNDAISLATVRGVAKDPRVRGIIQQKFPPPRSTPGAAGRAKEELNSDRAKRLVPFLENELKSLWDRFAAITKSPYEYTRVVSDFMRGDYKVLKIPAEMAHKQDLQDLDKAIRSKVGQLNKTKVVAGQSYEPEEDDVSDIQERLMNLEAQNEELERLLREE